MKTLNKTKSKFKRTLSMFLALCMVVTMMPTVSFAATMQGTIYVSGVQVTSSNYSDVLSDGTVSYDIAQKTLTLNNAKIYDVNYTTGYSTGYQNGIYVEGIPDFTIEVVGYDNFIEYSGSPKRYNGIFVENGDFNLTGEGLLTINTPDECVGYGIYMGDGTFNMDSGILYVKTSDRDKGIYSQESSIGLKVHDTNISGDAKIVVEGGKVSQNFLSPSKAMYVYGDLTISDDAFLLLTGGDAVETDFNGAGNGLFMIGSLEQTGGTLIANSGKGNPTIEVNAIYFSYAHDEYKLVDGVVEATGNICAINKKINTSEADSSEIKAGNNKDNANIVSAYTEYDKNNYVKVEAETADYWIVSFDSNGGTGTMPDVHYPRNSTERYTLPVNKFTAPEGKRFAMWQAVDSSGQEYYYTGESFIIDSDITIKVYWANISSNVTFDANGGSGEQEGFEAFYGTGYKLPQTTTFTAPYRKQFKGWAKTPDTTDVIFSETLLSCSQDTVLYAIWKNLSSYRIQSNPGVNGKISSTMAKEYAIVYHGEDETFFFMPDSGYEVGEVTVDGSKVEVTGNSYTIKNVTKSMNIHVEFDKIDVSTIPKPLKPTNVKAVAMSTDTIRVTWDKVTDADGYDVYRFVNGKSVFYKTFDENTNIFYNGGKRPNTTYYYKMRSYKIVNGEKLYSYFTNLVTCKTPATSKPMKPINVEANALSTSLIKVTWTKLSGVDGYEVYRFVNGKSYFYKVFDQSVTSFNNAGKQPNTTYYYKMRSYKIVDGKKVYSYFTDLVTCTTPK